MFSSWHVHFLSQEKPGGLGGNMPVQLVELFLKQQSRSVVTSQVAQQVRWPSNQQHSQLLRPLLTRSDIESISQKRARDLLRQLGLSTYGTMPELRDRLKRHYNV